MMKNRLTLLPLIMLMPLMMASKAQEPVKELYDNVDIYVNYVGVDASRGDRDNVCYEVKIDNAGDKHIAPFSSASFRNYYQTYQLGLEPKEQLFTDQVIAPGKSDTYYTYVSKNFDFAQRYDVYFNVYSHKITDIDFTGAEIKEDYKKSNQYVLKVDAKKIPNETLALFIDVTYNGEFKSFYMYFNATNRTFTTNEKLDLDQLKINQITAYKEQERVSSSSCNNGSTVLWVLLGIFFTLILSAILTPVIITAARRNRRY